MSFGVITRNKNTEKKQNYGTWIHKHINREDIYIDIPKDMETRFETLNYELKKPLPKGIKKSYWINDGWITWKPNDRVCHVKT